MHAALPETIQTARLRLRPMVAADKAVLVGLLNDLDVSRWLTVVVHPYTASDFDAYLPRARAGYVFIIEDNDGIAGCISRDQQLGYWLAARARGKGYATEAARAVMAAHFCASDLAVAAGYFSENDRSARVLAKLGFAKIGQGPKHCVALAADRPHVDVMLTRAGFIASQSIAAQSARLTYRDLQPFDAPELHALVSDFAVVRQLGSFPWPAEPAYTATRAVPFAGAGFAWGVHLAGALIGTVAVIKGELGYMIAPAHWRQGFAQEACQLALTHAFETLPLDEITAGVWADNAASLGLLTKLGFEVTATTNEMSKARGVAANGFDLHLTRKAWQNPSKA